MALSGLLTILLVLTVIGCNKTNPGSEPGPVDKGKGKRPLGEVKAPTLQYKLTTVSTEDFTLQLPQGWKYEVNPPNLQFGLVAYDPAHPERRLFYYYLFNPFMKSEEAHNFWHTYYPASMYASCPVLSTASVEEFYLMWNEYVDWLSFQGIRAAVTKFDRLSVVESHPLENYLSDYSLDSAVVRAHLQLQGSNLPCEGLFSGSVVSLSSYYQYGIDVSELFVYNVMGIMAPADEFPQLREVLANSLKSFTFSESYVREYLRQSQEATQTILENARTMQAAYVSSAAAWHNRQPVNDAIGQKDSDSTLGYDRLYDADTGEIIRAQVGWYDTYDLHRNEYSKPNIHKLEDNDYERYGQSIDYYIP